MRKRIRVTVTQEDIDRGRRMIGYECPFALAIMRRLNAEHVLALPGVAFVLGRAGMAFVLGRAYDTSTRAQIAILNYDAGDGMKPGTYYFSERDR